MRFTYQARTPEGDLRTGSIDAATMEIAVVSLQRRNLIIVSIVPEEEAVPLLSRSIRIFDRIKTKDVVILSRQMATLFEAKVPVVESLKIIVSEMTSQALQKELEGVLEDIQGGSSMSQAMGKHPKVFSSFYVNMVKSGEESGKLDEVFIYLADYLERSYELLTKARNALIYPAFVMLAFLAVMTLMLVVVIPKLSAILTEAAQELPIYTRLVLSLSDFLRNFGFILVLVFGMLGAFAWRYSQTPAGKYAFHKFQLSIPLVGMLYRKLYMSRIADNLQTLISGGIPAVRALEITADVVGNEVYRLIVTDAIEAVKGGSTISGAFARYDDIPPLMSQMIRIGEETGRLDSILKSLATFYRREVDSLVDNLVNLIEPILILALGLGVGLIVASVLVPIYNLAGALS
jgi:type II secretory pathway component PulF